MTALADKKYLVKPDYVQSKNDGQVHFVTCGKLVKLYGVNPKDCVLWNKNIEDTYLNWHTLFNKQYGHLIWLTPSYHGDYTLPEINHGS